DQHLQQLQQSIQQQQQQLHQQLAAGSSSINDLIGMLPQTAALGSSGAGGGGGQSAAASSSSGGSMSGPGEPLMSSHGEPPTHPSHPPHLPPPPTLPPHSQGNLPAHLAGIGGGIIRTLVPLGGPALTLVPLGGPALTLVHSGGLPSHSSHSGGLPSHSSHSGGLPSHSSHSPGHSSMHPHPSLLSPHSQDSLSQQGSLLHQSPGLMSSRMGLGMGLSPSLASISYTRVGDSYVCSLCGKTVVSKAAITRHIQLTHEKKKPFECNICHRRFGYKNILLEHQNIHFGIKPYACTMCDKRFAARSNLFQHRLLHMKPYCCYQCNKRFDREEQLQRHLKLHPTANVLSCSECPFTASNVEALNQHLQESHKLLTYDTRRHSSSFDSDGGDLPSQVMSLPSPTLTSPDNTKSSGLHGNLAGLDADPMRRIDSICSQLASRGGGAMGYHDGFQVKQEPLSPGSVRFPPDMAAPSSSHHFPPSASPSGGLGEPHFGHGGSPTSTISNPSGMGSGGGGMGLPRSSTAQHLSQFPSSMSRSYSSSAMADHSTEFYSGMGGAGGRKNTSPSSMEPARKYHHHQHTAHGASSPRGFMPPSRRGSSFGNGLGGMGPIGPLRHSSSSGGGAERVQSIADSTSNLSEFFSSLQGLVQRSQEIPELNVNISKPKITKEVGTQHTTTNLPGELPTLEDLLIYYESQGCLYRCQHCRISFEERGLYFLHKSLHGEMSPWQCSICQKICVDRNDFHLHFVNQQHRPEQVMH
ncbi:hypothetical protein EGW08_002853, partial [Elysia chlorotica]